MATVRQKQALIKMVENGGVVSRAMRDVGYSEETAKSPSKLTNSLGFQELLEEFGLTKSYVIEKLKEDIDAKPKARYNELNLASEITGLKKQEKQGDTQVTINVLNFNGDYSTT